jgi:hypothetical protein
MAYAGIKANLEFDWELARSFGLAGAFKILADEDPWLYYELELTNNQADHDLVAMRVDMPLGPPVGENVVFGFMEIDLVDSNGDGYVFAGDIPGEPPEGSFPLSTFRLGMEDEPETEYTGEMGANLVAPGHYEFASALQAGPRAGQADVMTAYLNLNLSPGDTIRIASGVLHLPQLDVGDYNGDETISGNDFLTWQRELGTTGDHLLVDGDDDGSVGGSDLAIWRERFQTSAPSTSVPEPAACAMLGLAMGAFFTARRRAWRSGRPT